MTERAHRVPALRSEVFARCACGYLPHLVALSEWVYGDGQREIVLSLLIPRLSWRDRLRVAWQVLRGQEPEVADVILDEAMTLHLGSTLLEWCRERWVEREANG